MHVASTLGSLKIPGIFTLNKVEISSDSKIPLDSSLCIMRKESTSTDPKILEKMPNFLSQLIKEISKIFSSPTVYGNIKFYCA